MFFESTIIHLKPFSFLIKVSISLAFCCVGCVKKTAVSQKDIMPVIIEVYPEDTTGWFILEWNDTLGVANKHTLFSRPYELHCCVKNQMDDTLGIYRGLSTSQQFVYFKVNPLKDDSITVDFKIAINPFSSFLADQSKGYLYQFFSDKSKLVHFHPVQLELATSLYNKRVLILY